MPNAATSVQQELTGWIARYAGAVKRVVAAYGRRRTREADINFLALQATKEYGAMAYHSGVALRKARAMPSTDQLAEARAKVLDVHVQEIRQRNEQFLHPLSEAEMRQLEADFRAGRIEPIWFFGALAG